MEQWKTIKGHPKYQVSNLGRIKSFKRVKPKLLKLSSVDNAGYIHIRIDKTMYMVSRLVALNFVRNTKHKPEVNHKNGIKTDNRATNLQWVNKSENLKHAFNTGLMKARKGEDSNFAKMTQEKADQMWNEFNPDLPRMEQYKILSNKYGLKERQVRDIVWGKCWNPTMNEIRAWSKRKH